MFDLGPIEIMMMLIVVLGGTAAVIAVVTARRRAATRPQLGAGDEQRRVGDGFTEPTGYVAHQPTPPEQQRRA